MTTTDYTAEAKKLAELSRRVEALEERYGIKPKTFLQDIEERIEKLEKDA